MHEVMSKKYICMSMYIYIHGFVCVSVWVEL